MCVRPGGAFSVSSRGGGVADRSVTVQAVGGGGEGVPSSKSVVS